jgi:hypothetical protein
VQRPEIKINHALVLGGDPGIGKDTILVPVKEAVGPWNFAETNPTRVLGRFNGFLKNIIIRVSEASDLGEFERIAFYEHTKAYTAAPPETLLVDEKNIREYQVLNVCGIIYTTNNKNGLYLPPDDRRHYVAWSERKQHEFNEGYWNDFHAWLENGGSAAVAAHLHELDLAGFNSKAPPRKTTGFWAMVSANQAPENSEMADTLDKCHRPDAITLSTIRYNAIDSSFRDWLDDRKNARRIPHRLEECGYTSVRNPDSDADGRWRIMGRRETIYANKNLSPEQRLRVARDLAEGRR